MALSSADKSGVCDGGLRLNAALAGRNRIIYLAIVQPDASPRVAPPCAGMLEPSVICVVPDFGRLSAAVSEDALVQAETQDSGFHVYRRLVHPARNATSARGMTRSQRGTRDPNTS